MKKGLSMWLFSKLVMFSFLIIIFAIMTQMTTLLNERAYSDSAALLTLNLKEAAGGVVNSHTVEIQKVIPLPEKLPQGSTMGNNYFLVIKKNPGSSPSSISFAVTRGTYSEKTFVSSSIVYLPDSIGTNLTATRKITANSQDYHYILIRKEEGEVYLYACEKFFYSISEQTYVFKNCLVPGNTKVEKVI